MKAKWYARFYPFKPSKWKTFSNDKNDITSAFCEVHDWQAADEGISINTKLLLALDVTSRDYLQKAKPRVWMSPVGLYTEVSRDTKPANRVSFIDLKVRNSDSLTTIQNDAKSQLKSLNYWEMVFYKIC